MQFVSPHPSMGQRNRYQSQGAAPAPSTLQKGPHRPGPRRRSGLRTGLAGQGFGSGWADDVLPLPPAWAYETRLS